VRYGGDAGPAGGLTEPCNGASVTVSVTLLSSVTDAGLRSGGATLARYGLLRCHGFNRSRSIVRSVTVLIYLYGNFRFEANSSI
jgi:hypothetical protein